MEMVGTMTTAKIFLPPKLVPVFAPPRGSVQYRALRGGRGGGKSQGAALVSGVWGYAEPLRILCVREFQSSIRDSFHAELKNAIETTPFLDAAYDVGTDYIRGKGPFNKGTEYIFRGARHSLSAIRSLAKIDLTIIEEAEDLSESSWLTLEATVFRQPKSEIWPIWNPRLDGSPVDNRMVKHPPRKMLSAFVNWNDNPFFPPNMETLRQREQERLDPNTYSHVWEGDYLTNSDAQVLANKVRIAEFEPQPSWSGPYQGGDFGFSQDPTAAVRCYINDDILYVSHEAGRLQLELNDTCKYISDRIPGFEKYLTYWDCARPESIRHISKDGLPRSEGCKKWSGSVEDGIAYLRSFRQIVVHPRCVETIKESRLYSYKVDRLSKIVLPDIVDANNHYWDAVRYALGPMIKSGFSYGMLSVVD